MILEQEINSVVSAPSFLDGTAMLEKYRTWSGISDASLSDLFSFMTTPSKDRSDFIISLTLSVTADKSGLFATQQYS